MKRVIKKTDFNFMPAGFGHYRVTYTSPVTFKKWSATLNDMPLIDSVKYEEEPLRKNMEALKRMVKTFCR